MCPTYETPRLDRAGAKFKGGGGGGVYRDMFPRFVGAFSPCRAYIYRSFSAVRQPSSGAGKSFYICMVSAALRPSVGVLGLFLRTVHRCRRPRVCGRLARSLHRVRLSWFGARRRPYFRPSVRLCVRPCVLPLWAFSVRLWFFLPSTVAALIPTAPAVLLFSFSFLFLTISFDYIIL